MPVGGPVYFLRPNGTEGGLGFGKLSKTYFFYSEEFRHDIRYPTLSSVVPTAALKAGVFPVVKIGGNAPISLIPRARADTVRAQITLSEMLK